MTGLGAGAFAASESVVRGRAGIQRFVMPDGQTLSYQLYGRPGGMPCLYLHGTPSSRIEASLIAEASSQAGVLLIAVDRPGIGCSSYTRQSPAEWAAHLRPFTSSMAHLHVVPRLGVLAFSGGTPFALALLLDDPQRYSAAAILSPRAPGAPGVPAGVVDPAVSFVRRRPRIAAHLLAAYARRLSRGKQPPRLAQLRRFAPVDQTFARQHARWLQTSFLEAVRCGTSGVVQDIDHLVWPWHLKLSAISHPVGLWQGTCDRAAPLQTGRYLTDCIPGASWTMLHGAGHLTAFANHAGDAMTWLRLTGNAESAAPGETT